MPGLEVTMTAEEADLFSKLTALVAKTGESERAFSKASEQSKAAAEAARQAAKEQERSANAGKRLADQLSRANESLEESYNRQVRTLESGLESGKISAEKFRESIKLLDKDFEQKRQSEIEASAAAKQAAWEGTDAYKKQQEEIRKGIRATERIIASTQTLEEENAALKRSIKAAFDAGEVEAKEYHRAIAAIETKQLQLQAAQLKHNEAATAGYGSSAIGKITSYVASVATIGTAWQAVTKLMEKYNEEKAKAVESISATKDSRRSLGQIANDSKDYQALVDASNRVAIAGGIDRELAQDFVFSGRSEGFDAEALAKFIPVVSADSLSKVAGQVNTLYGGSLSAEQTINAVLSGARSSRLNFEDLSSGLASVAEGGRLQKSSAEEQIGSLSVLASYFKSGDTAADRLKAFQTRMALGGQEFGVAGMGIVDATRAIQGMSPEDRSKLLGESQEVNAAFSALAENLPTIQQRIHEINGAIVNSGTRDSALQIALDAQFDSSTQQGRINLMELKSRRKVIEAEIQNEQFAGLEAQRSQGNYADMQAALQRNKVGIFGRTIADAAYNISTSLGSASEGAAMNATLLATDPWAVGRQYTTFNDSEQRQFQQMAYDSYMQTMNRQTEALESIRRNTEGQLITKPGDDN